MGNRTVLRSIRTDEDYVLQIDMSSLLYPGETVGAAVVSVALLLGSFDPNPLQVVGPATVSLNVVSQRLIEGTLGRSYVLRVTGTTNLGNNPITLADVSIIGPKT